MNILVVSSKFQPEYSGSGLRAHNTYKRFKKKYKINYDIITNSKIYIGNKKYSYDGIEIFRISPPFNIPVKRSILRSILFFFGILWEILYSWNYIRKNINRYSLLHTFGNTWTIGFFTWYFNKKKKPIIRELCNDMENPLYPIQIQTLMRPIFKKNRNLIIAISKKLEKLALKHNLKNIWERPNPVDENLFFIDYKNKYFYREKLTTFNQNDIVLNLVANFIDRKNQVFALEVLKLLPQKFKLILAGPLKDENLTYYQSIIKKINNLNLNDRVDIKKGFVDNFDEYLKCSDVFLFPSKAEGLGTPLLESQVCGVPVVSNYIQDITDPIIKKNKGGFCLNLNPQDWAIGIQKASEISKELLIENAKHVSNICSSKLIDEIYFKKINKLIVNEN